MHVHEYLEACANSSCTL